MYVPHISFIENTSLTSFRIACFSDSGLLCNWCKIWLLTLSILVSCSLAGLKKSDKDMLSALQTFSKVMTVMFFVPRSTCPKYAEVMFASRATCSCDIALLWRISFNRSPKSKLKLFFNLITLYENRGLLTVVQRDIVIIISINYSDYCSQNESWT